MKFDPALKAAVRDRAPDGVSFDRVEIEQALRWAYDVRASGRSRLDDFYRGTPVGRAAAEALAAYRPAPSRPASPPVIAVRVATFGLVGLGLTLLVIGAVAVLVRLAGGSVGLNVWGLAAAYLAWVAVGWLLRDRIGLTRPVTSPYAAVPAPRSGEPDPIATTMTDPELRPREPAPGETGRATR